MASAINVVPPSLDALDASLGIGASAVQPAPSPEDINKRRRQVSAALGNTPKVARDSYIDPRVFDRYRDGEAIPLEEVQPAKDIVRRLRFKGPVFLISGATGRGTKDLAEAVMKFLEEQRERDGHAHESSAEETRDAQPAST